MAINRVRIDYTVYPPAFKPGEDPYWDLQTFTKAKRKARQLGVGSSVHRNFNQTNKRDPPGIDWWSGKYCWRWTGSQFKKLSEIF